MKHTIRKLLILSLGFTGLVTAQDRPFVDVSWAAGNSVPGAVVSNIANHLSLQEEACVLSARRMNTLVDTFDQKIDRALRSLGYYHASWEKSVQQLDNCWKLDLRLDTGEPVIIDDVVVRLRGPIEEDSKISSVVDEGLALQGTQLNHAEYERFKRRLQSYSQRWGYIEGQYLEQTLQVNVDLNQAVIRLVYDGGPRYSFGETSFEGTSFNEEFLQRYQPFQYGQPYDSNLVGDFQHALLNTGYFDNVAVVQREPDRDNHLIPLVVTTTQTAKFETSIGLGFATDTGPRASLGFDHNRVNPVGHQYSANLKLSQVESSFDFGYRIPLANPRVEQASFRSGWTSENTDTSESDIWFVGGSRATEQDNGWLKTLDLVYQVESFQVGTTDDRLNLLIPGINWNKTRSNDVLYPTSGLSLLASVRGSAESPVSDTSFVQLTGSAKYIKKLGRGRLLTRINAGFTWVDETSELPASLRFFTGGDNSVRGYEYQSLGPEDAEGDVVGGRHMVAASVEYEFELSSKYGLAVFYDVGNAFDNTSVDVQESVGFGGRWRSPVGPIRIDFGFPVDSNLDFRVHLTMGSDL
ncbi:MAG: autotransporter assembly complex protein TamA [Porticoccaceae bacterium]